MTAAQIALRYACVRQQFGKLGNETRLIEYPLHQYRLIRPLAWNVCHSFAIRACAKLWDKNRHSLFDLKNTSLHEFHAIICTLKGLCSESAHKTLQEARECCGGIGFSHYAGIGFRLHDHDV